MELKVWVEGIQRIVCGVTETTTCQDVVFALAHATGKSGRFTLIERWRCNERLLAPNEQPLKILSKWGEYSSDVQFILQWNDSNNKNNSPIQPNQFSNNIGTKLKTQNPPPVLNPTVAASNLLTPQNPISIDTTDKASKGDFQIYKGISSPPNKSEVSPSSSSSDHLLSPKKQYHPPVHNVLNASNSSSPLSSHHNDILKREVPPYKEPPSPPVPPPYRDPPPPQQTQNLTNNNNYKQKKNYIKDINRQMEFNNDENNMYNSQYKELIQLVNYQREKLSLQQADLTKYDAEIVYWESKSREHQGRLDFIAQELVKVSNISRVNNDKIKALSYIEEENEIVRQQEKTLKSEITLLRSKLANCETELLQCKNKIRLLMDELQLEKRAQLRLGESQMQLERSLLTEVDRLQHELELANQSTERNQATAEQLKRDVAILESAIVNKKKEVESLVNEMKEANLLSLSITSAEEIRHLLEGPIKAGSTRKIIGSPRQLENAVPTNKNPHGVWV